MPTRTRCRQPLLKLQVFLAAPTFCVSDDSMRDGEGPLAAFCQALNSFASAGSPRLYLDIDYVPRSRSRPRELAPAPAPEPSWIASAYVTL